MPKLFAAKEFTGEWAFVGDSPLRDAVNRWFVKEYPDRPGSALRTLVVHYSTCSPCLNRTMQEHPEELTSVLLKRLLVEIPDLEIAFVQTAKQGTPRPLEPYIRAWTINP